MPMLNFYEEIRTGARYNKFVIGNLLFAEYTCPLEESSVALWAETDYLVHVISGRKTWHTTNGSWSAERGQSLFFKKGAAVVEQFFDEDFCLLLFFIPDDFVRSTVMELGEGMPGRPVDADPAVPAFRVHDDPALGIFFQSMVSYFRATEPPSEHLLRLKLRELILGMLVSRDNPALASYLRSVGDSHGPSVRTIMDENFRYNLSLAEFAQLCHRSLSSFKRDFQKEYGQPPGRWLLTRRLDYAAVLLRSNCMNVSQVVYEAGFEDLSHFSRAFKERFGVPPTLFRGSSGGKP